VPVCDVLLLLLAAGALNVRARVLLR
jgi:hypothetical protein